MWTRYALGHSAVCSTGILLLSACGPAETETPTPDNGPVTGYQADVWFEPAPPAANTSTAMWYSILDQDGAPIEDIQQSHQRMVHVFFISSDLTYFRHSHHEDFSPVTSENLRTATFTQPITFPYSGDFLLGLDFAHQNLEHMLLSTVAVSGDVPQQSEIVPDFSTTVWVAGPTTVGETLQATASAVPTAPVEPADPAVTATLSWETPPQAGFVSEWTLNLLDSNGNPLTDVVQWLGADAHVAIVDADLSALSHTHAYVEGMENMPPTHTMPHEYDGPTLPFRFVFEFPGLHKMWIQFARAEAPDAPYVIPFFFEVAP